MKIISDEAILKAKMEAERLSWTHTFHPAYEKEKFLLNEQLISDQEFVKGKVGEIETILEAGDMFLNPPEDLAAFIIKPAVIRSRADQIVDLLVGRKDE